MAGKRTRTALVAAMLMLALTSGARAEPQGDLKIVGTQILCFDDGRTIERYLVRDLRSGEVFARTAEEIPRLVEETFSLRAGSSNGGLTPFPTRRLPTEIKRMDFHLNSHADEHRAYFNEIVNQLINPLRPVKRKKPKIRIQAEVIDPDYRRGDMFRDFMDDGVNMIYTHPDDLGLPAEIVGATVGMASSYWDFETFTYRGGDIALTALSLQGDAYDRMVRRLIHEFGHIFGYYHTGWIEDVMSYVAPWFRWEYYWDPANFVWETSRLKDEMIYGGRRRADGNYRAAVEMLPPPDSIIAMEYLKVKAPASYLGRHVMFLTTLKGYPDRPMTLTLYRGTEVRDNRKIVSISGHHPWLFEPDAAGLLEHYNTSILYFTKQRHFKKLSNAVKRFGEPAVIHDLPYSHVLRVTAVIEGYRGPDDPELVSHTRTVRFAYREEGQEW